MFNVAIIGFGNIGKHHLSSCLKNKYVKNIYVIDKNENQFKIFSEINHKKNIFYTSKISKLNTKIDILIISTNSIERFAVIKNFLSKNIVKFMILEKFLFNNKNQYNQLNKIISNKNIKSYVNCPRRISNGYKLIKQIIKNDNIIMNFYGSNWNLASNSIHYLDLFSYFISSFNLKIIDKDLSTPFNTKRNGYSEIKGRFSFKSNHSYLNIHDYNDVNENKLTIICKNKIIEVKEDKNIIKVFNSKKTLIKKIEFKLDMISESTNKIINDLYKNNNCSLITLNCSSKLHLTFLEALNNKNKFLIT